ncbi:unnamed protein product [Effrenium voratum]|nr:unnamed protein product [Effrenium voratum]
MSPDKSAEQVCWPQTIQLRAVAELHCLHRRQRRARFTHLLQSAGRFAAGPEIVVLVLSSGLNAWLMLYKAWLMREFVVGQNLGRWREWLKALAKFPLAIMASAVLSQTTKYMQASCSMTQRQPYFYSFVIVPLSYRLTSPDWSAARLVQKANGAYQQALQAIEHCKGHVNASLRP